MDIEEAKERKKDLGGCCPYSALDFIDELIEEVERFQKLEKENDVHKEVTGRYENEIVG